MGPRGVTQTSKGAVAGRIAALALVIALATGGLTAAGAISLPDLPTAASDRAEAVHDALEQGNHPGEERCAFGLGTAAAASDGHGQVPTVSEACGRAESAAARKADRPERGTRGRQGAVTQNSHSTFGDTVSDRATAGEPQEDGRAFGQSVSGEAQQHAPALPPQAENGRETGEIRSEQGQENGQAFSEQGQATGEAHSEQGRGIADNASGGRVP